MVLNMNYWKQSPNYIYVAAHRGDSARYPENTMESFRAAVEEGVDQIELDVRMTKDGEAKGRMLSVKVSAGIQTRQSR